MAKITTWQMLHPLFKPKNFGEGAYENMQDRFLVSLQKFRVAMDNPMIVHVGYATKGHSKNSFHYKGRAIDFHFKYNPVPTRKIIVTAIKCGLYGVGFYPYWKPFPGGMHLDNRSPGKFNIWSRNNAGIYTYTFPNKIPESLEEWL